jgi:hypothetical protein
MSNFANPNQIDFKNVDTDEQFDAFYLIIKVANNLIGLQPKENTNEEQVVIKKKIKVVKPDVKVRKPLIMADGLVTMDILKTLSKNISSDVFFCPSVIPDVAKSVLAEHLKVNTKFNYLTK